MSMSFSPIRRMSPSASSGGGSRSLSSFTPNDGSIPGLILNPGSAKETRRNSTVGFSAAPPSTIPHDPTAPVRPPTVSPRHHLKASPPPHPTQIPHPDDDSASSLDSMEINGSSGSSAVEYPQRRSLSPNGSGGGGGGGVNHSRKLVSAMKGGNGGGGGGSDNGFDDENSYLGNKSQTVAEIIANSGYGKAGGHRGGGGGMPVHQPRRDHRMKSPTTADYDGLLSGPDGEDSPSPPTFVRESDAMSVSSGASSTDEMFDMIGAAIADLKIIGDDGRLMDADTLVQMVSSSVTHAIRSLCPVAILVMDANCMLMDANPKAEDVLGLAREQLVGHNINQILPPEVAAKHDDYVASYIKRYAEKRGPPKSSIVGSKTPREVICKRFVDGKSVHFAAEVSVRGIPHPAGRQHPPLFFIGYIEDVTARKELREALQINTFIRDATDSALIVMNDFGKIIEFNTAAARMFRYDPMFVRGHNVKKLMPPDVAVIHDEMLRRFRERVASGLMHTSPIIGKTRTLYGYRPKFDEDGNERFKIELRVEAFSGGKMLVAFIRDINSSASESDFMMKTTSDTFPEHTVDRLMRGEAVWDRMENTTLLFSDVEAFSRASATMEPEEVFNFINEMVSSFDEMGFGMEKIKTIGDGYMAYFKSADDAIYTSLRMMEWSRENNVRIRIGLHTGTVVSGVVGKKRRTFDMWGDVVNTAKRMEETGTSCQLQISEECFASITNAELREIFKATTATVKSKGVYTTYITRFPDDEMPEIVSTLIADREMEQREQESMVNARKQRMSEYM